jgi:mannose-6-phosphate isomerase-like protein (cupin superfamily)
MAMTIVINLFSIGIYRMEKIKEWLDDTFQFNIFEKNEEKHWGAYWVIDSRDSNKFEQKFFEKMVATNLPKTPKFLIIAPKKRLSLQIHNRRNEKWKVIRGKVDAIVGDQYYHLQEGDEIYIPVSIQHRLIGSEDWSVVAEVWLHTDQNYPSDENDITRIQDDVL